MTSWKSRILPAVILLLILLLSLSACSGDKGVSETPELELEKPDPVETPGPEDNWKYDYSGIFAYREIDLEEGLVPYMKEDVGCPENIIIYKTANGKYGYMNLEFKDLTGPVNNFPIPFEEGKCLLMTDNGNPTIVNGDFKPAEYQFRSFAIDGNDVIFHNFNYDGTVTYEIQRDIDPDEFLVPVTIYEPGVHEIPLTGFKTLSTYRDNSIKDDEGFEVEPKYLLGSSYNGGYYTIIDPGLESGRIGFVDKLGNKVIDYIYDGSIGFRDGFASVVVNEDNEISGLKEGHYIIDEQNNVVAGPFSSYHSYSGGIFAIMDERGLVSFLDTDGNMLCEEKFVDTKGFRNGIALVMKENGYTFIDNEGKRITDSVFRMANHFSEGTAAVEDMNGSFGFLNDDGSWFIKPKYEYAGSFFSGYAHVCETYLLKGYLIDKSGNKYLEELNPAAITCFNEEGYALASSVYVEDGEMKTRYYLVLLLP